jgi:hypothetical protein
MAPVVGVCAVCGNAIHARPYQDGTIVRACSAHCASVLTRTENPDLRGGGGREITDDDFRFAGPTRRHG